MKTKIVPDPPHTSVLDEKCAVVRDVIGRCIDYLAPESDPSQPPRFGVIDKTAAPPTDYLNAHKLPVFTVREGVDVEVALQHVSFLLKAAEYVADDLGPSSDDLVRDQIWSITHSVEMARAVVEALLRGVHRSGV
ncbi:hypothetical protein [Pseudomonas vanderleydeniana]|uniref:DUF3077 domain-containing protein n=1 Tax=Pseudomonas vanderleydeniana TaxID=2745495 RepID=A0A9E6PLB8_9PSED|nr:hypothetical protein [Pseudomonas vanderleydeniana]QXI28550.1 hypothetical protein HU752_000920 [Pseudomonas vanderleydeniana]